MSGLIDLSAYPLCTTVFVTRGGTKVKLTSVSDSDTYSGRVFVHCYEWSVYGRCLNAGRDMDIVSVWRLADPASEVYDEAAELRAALAAEQARAERAEATLREIRQRSVGYAYNMGHDIFAIAEAALALRPSGDGVG